MISRIVMISQNALMLRTVVCVMWIAKMVDYSSHSGYISTKWIPTRALHRLQLATSRVEKPKLNP
jgi:hypothetical protein